MAKQALYKETSDDPLGARLYLTSYRVIRHAEQTLGSFDMTFHTYLALYYIDKVPRISIKDLCEYMDVSQSIVSRTVQNLQGKNMLKKTSSTDKRKTELALTPEARKKLKKASGKLNELSFIMRHQPDFRIAEIELQLEKIQKAVQIAKNRPLLRSEPSDAPSQSVIVRLSKKLGAV